MGTRNLIKKILTRAKVLKSVMSMSVSEEN